MKIYISAQAQQKHYLAQTVQSSAIVIIEHLLKLTVMPNNYARNHWESEIAGQLHHVQSLKNTKKPPSSQDLFKWTYSNNIDFIDNVDWIDSELGNFEVDYNIVYDGDVYELAKDFKEICFEYFSWLSEKLCVSGFVNNREIYNKLDQLV